jgi:hypothetical protein
LRSFPEPWLELRPTGLGLVRLSRAARNAQIDAAAKPATFGEFEPLRPPFCSPSFMLGMLSCPQSNVSKNIFALRKSFSAVIKHLGENIQRSLFAAKCIFFKDNLPESKLN